MKRFLVIFKSHDETISQVIKAFGEIVIREYFEKEKPYATVLGIFSGVRHIEQVGSVRAIPCRKELAELQKREKEILRQREIRENFAAKAFVVVGGPHTLMPKPRGKS